MQPPQRLEAGIGKRSNAPSEFLGGCDHYKAIGTSLHTAADVSSDGLGGLFASAALISKGTD